MSQGRVTGIGAKKPAISLSCAVLCCVFITYLFSEFIGIASDSQLGIIFHCHTYLTMGPSVKCDVVILNLSTTVFTEANLKSSRLISYP